MTWASLFRVVTDCRHRTVIAKPRSASYSAGEAASDAQPLVRCPTIELMPNRREILLISALPAIGALAVPGAPPNLPDITMNSSRAKPDRQPFGGPCIFFDGPTNQLQLMTAASRLPEPAMSPHPPHRHPEEEIMVVTKGTGEMVVEGKVAKVGLGAMMYCAAGMLQDVKNTGTQPSLFYFYRWRA